MNLDFEVNVTDEDINRAHRRTSTSCPVALAITRQFRECIAATFVETASFVVKNSEVYANFAIPAEISKRITAFDYGGDIWTGLK